MIDLELRGIKDRLLNPLARAIGTAVHPTVLSLIGFAVGLGALAAAAIGLNIVALILWLVNRIIDGLDGAVARAAGKASDLGGYLDIALDFFIYAGFPLVLAIGGGAGAWPAAALLLASFYVNAALWMSASALLEKRRLNGASETESGGGPRRTSMLMPRGLVEGFETIVFFSLMILLPTRFALIAGIMAALVLAGALLSLISMIRLLRTF